MAEKQLDLDQLPSEFECCFCTFKVLTTTKFVDLIINMTPKKNNFCFIYTDLTKFIDNLNFNIIILSRNFA